MESLHVTLSVKGWNSVLGSHGQKWQEERENCREDGGSRGCIDEAILVIFLNSVCSYSVSQRHMEPRDSPPKELKTNLVSLMSTECSN